MSISHRINSYFQLYIIILIERLPALLNIEMEVKTDKTILLCEHLSCIHTQNMNANPLKNNGSVIEALKNFKGIIIQLCGHSHCDYAFSEFDEKYSPWFTAFSNLQRCSRRRQSDLGDITEGCNSFECPKREAFTVTEDCWDVVVVKPKSPKINFVRFGAGEDREYLYSLKLHRSGECSDGNE